MARESMVPVAVPAVPASSLHTATKSYADGLDPVNLVGADAGFIKSSYNVAQTISTNSDTWVTYTTDDVTHGMATKSALSPGHKWTFNTTGIYTVTGQCRFAFGSAGGERYYALWSDQSGSDAAISATGYWSNAGTEYTMTATYTGKFTAGKYVAGRVWQSSGFNCDLVTFWRWFRIALIRKYV